MKTPPSPPIPPARRGARRLAAPATVAPATLDDVVAGLLALASEGEPPVLWSRAELSRRLTPAERPQLDAALARLREERQVLGLSQGKGTYYVFAGALRRWLAEDAVAGTVTPLPLVEVYRRLVRESGGFPDVKIAALQAATGGTLAAELTAAWRRGEATLSLGDWSLADEGSRAAAVELDGERYLLVRFEEAD